MVPPAGHMRVANLSYSPPKPVVSHKTRLRYTAQHCIVQAPRTAALWRTKSLCQRSGTAVVRSGSLRARRKDDDYEDVLLDDDGLQADTGAGLIPSLLQGAWQFSGRAADTLTDVVSQFVPEGTSRAVVKTSVSAALVLFVLALAKSVLNFFLTAGLVILGLYVATRIFGIQISESDGAGVSKRPGAQGKARQRRASRPPGGGPGLGAGDADEDDVVDVWFENVNRRRK